MDDRHPAGSDPGAGSPGDLVGSVLAGRYRIVAKLGEGAMGAVYLGEHLKIGRQDAIKVLRANLAADREATARFLRGARNVSAIRHPNVCTIYDFSDTDEGVQFLAMEYVPGETLKDLLDREGALSLERAVDIAAKAAAALEAAHEAGIVHRDLKPANIMIAPGRDSRDIVKVVDFDIAKGSAEGEGSEVTRHGFVVGTPEYMSPEQLIGEALDGRSDVYSLALVLFRMITGGLPFRSTGTQDMMIERLTDTPRRLAEVRAGAYPPALEDALALALERRATDRTPSSAEFARQITASLGQAPASPVAHSGPPRDVPATSVSPSSGGFPRPGGLDARGGTGAAVGRTDARRPSTDPGSTPPWWRNPITMAAGVVGLAALAVTTTLIISDARRPGPDPIELDTTQQNGGRGETGNDSTVIGNGANNGGDQQEPDSGSIDTRGGGGGGGGGGNTGGGGGGNTGGGGGTAIVVSAAGAQDRLLDLIGRVVTGTSDAVLAARRDTAQAYYDLGSGVLTETDLGYAAHIIGRANCLLGERDDALVWLQRAVALAPEQQGFVLYLENNRGPNGCSGRL